MSQFTDAEQAFIDATIPVLKAGEDQRLAYIRFEEGSRAAELVGEEQLGDQGKDVEYVHTLMMAAAEQSGFGPESDVVAALNAGLEGYRQIVALMDEAAAEAIDQSAAPGVIV
jgi:hypothetical protein